MSQNTLRYLKFAYYFGVFLGVFTFAYNSTTNRFVLSKKLQIYNRIVTMIVLVFLVFISLSYQPTIPSDGNQIIDVATPINFFLLIVIMLNTYLVFIMKEQKIVEMLNYGLEINELVTNNGNSFQFGSKLFLNTFAIDAFFFIFLLLTIYRSCIVHLNMEAKFILVVTFLNASKNFNRFVTHLYICGILYNVHLLSNIEMETKDTIGKFETFLRAYPEASSHQMAMKCCKLSDELDFYAIKCGRILDLTKRVHSLFSRHLLFMMPFNFADVLGSVRGKLYLM